MWFWYIFSSRLLKMKIKIRIDDILFLGHIHTRMILYSVNIKLLFLRLKKVGKNIIFVLNFVLYFCIYFLVSIFVDTFFHCFFLWLYIRILQENKFVHTYICLCTYITYYRILQCMIHAGTHDSWIWIWPKNLYRLQSVPTFFKNNQRYFINNYIFFDNST